MVPDTSPEWDLPATEHTQSYIICSAPRTGSNLLAFTLGKQGIGVPLEYLNIMGNPEMQGFLLRIFDLQPDHKLTINNVAQLKLLRSKYLEKVLKRRITPNGYFGVKIFSHHLKRMYPDQTSLVPVVEQLNTPVKYIHLWRGDLCKMAVSFYFAQVRQQWHSEMNKRRSNNQTPQYDFETLRRHLQFSHDIQEAWKFLLKDIDPNKILSMNYENLSQDFTNTIQATNRFLGFNDVDVPPESIQKQSSLEKSEMVERFKAECQIKEPWVFEVDYSIPAGTIL